MMFSNMRDYFITWGRPIEIKEHKNINICYESVLSNSRESHTSL